MFLTRPPRDPPEDEPVRLACIRHAASVDPEPGSNSPPKNQPRRPARRLCGEVMVCCIVESSGQALDSLLVRFRIRPATRHRCRRGIASTQRHLHVRFVFDALLQRPGSNQWLSARVPGNPDYPRRPSIDYQRSRVSLSTCSGTVRFTPCLWLSQKRRM